MSQCPGVHISVSPCVCVSLAAHSAVCCAPTLAPTDLALRWVWGNWRVLTAHCSVLARRGWCGVRWDNCDHRGQRLAQPSELSHGQPHNKWQRPLLVCSDCCQLRGPATVSTLSGLSPSAAEHWLLFIQKSRQDTDWPRLLGRGPTMSQLRLWCSKHRLCLGGTFTTALHCNTQQPVKSHNSQENSWLQE